ncbi:MAG: PAS domain S-box protein [Syntrophaceae bacterium]
MKEIKNTNTAPVQGMYRAAFEASEDAIILGDVGGPIRECNLAACRMFGYGRAEMRKIRLAGLFPEEVSAVLPDIITEDATTGGLFVWRSCKRKDGRIFPARISTQLIRTGGRKLVLACIRNLVIRKSAGPGEESKQPPAKDYPIYTITWQSVGDDFVMIGCNMASEDFKKIVINDFIGKRAGDIYGDRRDILEDLKRCLKEKSVSKRKMPYRMFTTGEERDISATYVYMEPGLILLHLRDITEREQAMKALRDSEQRMRSLFLGMPVPAVTWKLQGGNFVLSDYNLAAEKFTSGMISEYAGAPADRIYSDRPDILQDLKTCLERKTRFKREMNYRMFTTGSDRVLAMTYAYIPPDLVMCHMDDITRRKLTENELRRSEKNLKTLSSQLLGREEKIRKNIALELHDSIGQYLSTIKFNAETCMSRMESGNPGQSLEQLKSGIPIIRHAIEEVRRISMDLRPSILDDLGIMATISWFCREFEHVYSGISVEKEINVEEDSIPEPLKIIIYRVMQEAMNNVAKHSGADRVALRLEIAGGSLQLLIRDNGAGFDLDKIVIKEGLSRGLGLASMRERVELSGGVFLIGSKEGSGTEIRASWQV